MNFKGGKVQNAVKYDVSKPNQIGWAAPNEDDHRKEGQAVFFFDIHRDTTYATRDSESTTTSSFAEIVLGDATSRQQ